MARRNYRVFGSQLGAGYGVPTPAGQEAARLAAHYDGILLGHTYTAKPMAGLIQGIRDGSYGPGDRVVFFHTGGLAGLLATDKQTTETPPGATRNEVSVLIFVSALAAQRLAVFLLPRYPSPAPARSF